MATYEEAKALYDAGKYITASKLARAVIEQEPGNLQARVIEVRSLLEIGHDLHRCRESAEALIRAAPDNASALHTFGCCVAALGDLDGAKSSFFGAINIDPLFHASHLELATLYKFSTEDDVRLLALLSAERLARDKGEVRDGILFALTKAYDDLKQPEKAMRYALAANAAADKTFDRVSFDQFSNSIAEASRCNKINTAEGAGSLSEAPIFIVGMPRSGTTLAEIILSRHPKITACGELPLISSAGKIMSQAAGATIPNFDGQLNPVLHLLQQDHLRQASAQYLLHAKNRGSVETPHLTDKMPGNVRMLGLISRLFPRAKIIYMRRHPLDNAISNFFTRFAASGMSFTFDQQTLGHYARGTAESAELWRAAIPNPILDVSYELLVSDPEAQIRRLVQFIGLDWDENCLTPEQSSATVFTASRSQVRATINTKSKDRWRAYEPWLDPLIEAMGGMDWINAQVEDAQMRGAAAT